MRLALAGVLAATLVVVGSGAPWTDADVPGADGSDEWTLRETTLETRKEL